MVVVIVLEWFFFSGGRSSSRSGRVLGLVLGGGVSKKGIRVNSRNLIKNYIIKVSQ